MCVFGFKSTLRSSCPSRIAQLRGYCHGSTISSNNSSSMWFSSVLKLNPASVPQLQIKSWTQSFGWGRKEQLYCFARQRQPLWANALETVCPNLEWVVRSFMVMVQRGLINLWTFWLVGGEVSRSQHHQCPGSNQSAVSCLQAAYHYLLPPGGRSVSAK